MRDIKAQDITEAVSKLCQDACVYLPADVENSLKASLKKEESPAGREALKLLIENVSISREEGIPLCQDCGFAVIFLELGQEVHIIEGNLNEAVTSGVKKGYDQGFLRKSIVDDPVFERKNTGDNTPPVIYTDIVPGDKLRIIMTPKGGGSENMSALAMLKPASGIKGVKDFVIETVLKAGSNPCPPIIVGVGIGGTADKAMVIAKKSLLRAIGSHNPRSEHAQLEKELLDEINKLGIGPQGFGGRVTALAVHVETYPCHIASMPVAVNIQCHSARHKEIIL